MNICDSWIIVRDEWSELGPYDYGLQVYQLCLQLLKLKSENIHLSKKWLNYTHKWYKWLALITDFFLRFYYFRNKGCKRDEI